jgi:lysyl oxidase/CARDB protein
MRSDPSSISPSTFALVESLESRLLCSAAAPTTPTDIPQAPDATTTAHANLPDLLPWANRRRGYIFGWSLDRSEKPGHLLLRLTTAIANQGAGPLELRGGRTHANTSQEVMQRIFNDDGTFTDRLAGTFTYHPAHHHTHFDDFAAYRLREVTPNNGVGKIIKGGSKLSFCLTDSDEFNMNLPNASANGDYFACDAKKQGISVGWSDVYNSSLPDQWIDITNVKPGKYWLEVVADPRNRILESNEKNNTTRIMVNLREIKPPRNDNFADRISLSGRTITTTGHNNQASVENGEANITERTDGSSVWWSWTAPLSGRVTIDTAGSSFDTVLAVFTGNSFSNLNRIARNDDDGTQDVRTSRLTFQATKGITYAIDVAGYNSASGRIHLNLSSGG